MTILIEKMPYHIVLVAGFLLFAAYTVVTRSIQLPWFDRSFLAFGTMVFAELLIGWRYAGSYEKKLNWCKWNLSLLYAVFGVFYGGTFVMACIERGWHNGIASIGLLSVGMAVMMFALTSKPGVTKRVNGAIGAFSVFVGILISRTGNGDSFVVFVFAPFIAATSALLGLVVWRDARTNNSK